MKAFSLLSGEEALVFCILAWHILVVDGHEITQPYMPNCLEGRL